MRTAESHFREAQAEYRGAADALRDYKREVNRIHPETITPMVFIEHRKLLMRIVDQQIDTLEFFASLLDRVIALDARVNELEGRPDGGNHS